MNYVKWLKYCWWLFFSYKGRIGRIIFLISWIIWAQFYGFLYYLDIHNMPFPPAVIIILLLIVIYSMIPIIVKRLHDTGRSAWHVFKAFIPLIGVFWLLIICVFYRGTDGENQ